MKRSALVHLLSNYILKEGVKLEYEDGADKLLRFLEELGMQPPSIKLEQLFPDSGLKEVGESHYYALWEPEDGELKNE